MLLPLCEQYSLCPAVELACLHQTRGASQPKDGPVVPLFRLIIEKLAMKVSVAREHANEDHAVGNQPRTRRGSVCLSAVTVLGTPGRAPA